MILCSQWIFGASQPSTYHSTRVSPGHWGWLGWRYGKGLDKTRQDKETQKAKWIRVAFVRPQHCVLSVLSSCLGVDSCLVLALTLVSAWRSLVSTLLPVHIAKNDVILGGKGGVLSWSCVCLVFVFWREPRLPSHKTLSLGRYFFVLCFLKLSCLI